MLPIVDVAHLQLTEELGRVGLGTVLTGILLGKPIAVMQYRYDPHVSSSPGKDRKVLHTEAMLLKRVKHPNVVRYSVSSLTMEQRPALAWSNSGRAKALPELLHAKACWWPTSISSQQISCFARPLSCTSSSLTSMPQRS